MKSMLSILVASAFLGSAAGFSGENAVKPTELAKAAAAMKPGEWRELKTEGMSRNLIFNITERKAGNHTPITVYTNRLNWDPITRTIPYIGAPHNGKPKFIMYTDKTNAWTTIPKLPKGLTGGHSYCTHTVTNDGVFYLQGHARRWQHKRNLLYRYDLRRKQEWTEEQIPKGYNVDPGHCLSYFEPLNALVQWKGTLAMYDLKTKKWSRIPAKLEPLKVNPDTKVKTGHGTLHHVMAVSHVKKLAVIGGGDYNWRSASKASKVLYAMDAEKKVTRLPDAPVGLGVTKATMSADPVTGDILVTRDGELYSLDLAKKKWTHHKDRKPAFKGQNLAGPISTYGVNLFFSPRQLKVFLYKHAVKSIRSSDAQGMKAAG